MCRTTDRSDRKKLGEEITRAAPRGFCTRLLGKQGDRENVIVSRVARPCLCFFSCPVINAKSRRGVLQARDRCVTARKGRISVSVENAAATTKESSTFGARVANANFPRVFSRTNPTRNDACSLQRPGEPVRLLLQARNFVVVSGKMRESRSIGSRDKV